MEALERGRATEDPRASCLGSGQTRVGAGTTASPWGGGSSTSMRERGATAAETSGAWTTSVDTGVDACERTSVARRAVVDAATLEARGEGGPAQASARVV
jgi:hypothetical protein